MDAEQKKRFHRGTIAALVAVLVLVVYPLSIGPIYWLVVHDKLPVPLFRALVVVYWPVDWLYDNSTSFASVLDWYLELWGPELFTPGDPA